MKKFRYVVYVVMSLMAMPAMAEPKYKAGDCVAYYAYGKYHVAEERWEKTRDLPPFSIVKIVEVGHKEYLEDEYMGTSDLKYGPNRTADYIESLDRKHDTELVDCSDMEKLFRRGK